MIRPELGRNLTGLRLRPDHRQILTNLRSKSDRFAATSTATPGDHKSIQFQSESDRDPSAPTSPRIQGLVIVPTVSVGEREEKVRMGCTGEGM